MIKFFMILTVMLLASLAMAINVKGVFIKVQIVHVVQDMQWSEGE